MPIYDYKCHVCDEQWESLRSVKDRLSEICTNCGALASIQISRTARPVCHEYYSENLGAYVTGPAQKRRLMKAKNLEEA